MASPAAGTQQPAPSGLAKLGFSPAPFIHAVGLRDGVLPGFHGSGCANWLPGNGHLERLAGNRRGDGAHHPRLSPERRCPLRSHYQHPLPAEGHRHKRRRQAKPDEVGGCWRRVCHWLDAVCRTHPGWHPVPDPGGFRSPGRGIDVRLLPGPRSPVPGWLAPSSESRDAG